MLTRVISGAVLLALTLALLFAGGMPLAVVVMLLSVSAFHELTGACGLKKHILTYAGYAGTVVYYLAIILGAAPVYWMAVVAMVFFAMMSVYVFSFPKIHADQVMTAFFCFLYGTVLFAFLIQTKNQAQNTCIKIIAVRNYLYMK